MARRRAPIRSKASRISSWCSEPISKTPTTARFAKPSNKPQCCRSSDPSDAVSECTHEEAVTRAPPEDVPPLREYTRERRPTRMTRSLYVPQPRTLRALPQLLRPHGAEGRKRLQGHRVSKGRSHPQGDEHRSAQVHRRRQALRDRGNRKIVATNHRRVRRNRKELGVRGFEVHRAGRARADAPDRRTGTQNDQS